MNMTPSERIEFERTVKAVKEGKFDKYEGRVTPPTRTPPTPPTVEQQIGAQGGIGGGNISAPTGTAAGIAETGGLAQGDIDVEGFGGGTQGGIGSPAGFGDDPGSGFGLWKKGGLVSKKMKQKKGSKGLASV